MGLDQGAITKLLDRARREVDDGLLPSCQLALGYEGEVVVHETFGDATPDTRYIMYSATKPFVASVMWQLIAEGLIDPAARVTEYFPSFGANGKEAITVEQVMLHTSGFPQAPMNSVRWVARASRQQVMTDWHLNWEPGTAFEYHPTSAHWVLAELIDTVTGGDYRDELEQRVTGPIGIGRMLGVGDGVTDTTDRPIAVNVFVGDGATPDELEAAFGIRQLPVTEVTDTALLRFNEPGARAVGVPGGGGIADATQIVRFYQELLHNKLGLWPADLLADVTGRVRNTFPDPFTKTSANRSLGLVLAGADGRSHLRGMGRTLSPEAFGHNGAKGQLVWADPATGLSFAYLTNGLDANEVREPRRGTSINSLAGVCATRA